MSSLASFFKTDVAMPAVLTHKLNEVVNTVNSTSGTSNSNIEGKETIDFTFVTELPVSGVEDQYVVIKGENTDTLYHYESGSWVSVLSPDASKLYFDTDNSELYAYVTADSQFIRVTTANTIIVGVNETLNNCTALKTIKNSGVYNVIQQIVHTTKGKYLKNWVLTVQAVDYEEYDTGDSIYQKLENNVTIQKRTWSSTRLTNDGWSNFSTYYEGLVKDSTISKYYTWSSDKINTLIGTGTYQGGDNIDITNNVITALGYTYNAAKNSLATSTGIASGLRSQAEGSSIAAGSYTHSEGLSNLYSGLTVLSKTSNSITVSSIDYSISSTPYVLAVGDILCDVNKTIFAKVTSITEQSEQVEEETVVSYVIGLDGNMSSVQNEDFRIAYGVAYASNAHAEGNSTIATGNNSHSEGYLSKAIGSGSHAEGKTTEAIGNFSHAEGESTKATVPYAHAEGRGSIAAGNYSHVEGYNSQTTTSNPSSNTLSASTSTTNGYISHAEGNATLATGYNSHAEGKKTFAKGGISHAEGERTIASGLCSHAEGSYTTASGDISHAEGLSTTASGDHSHAEGYNSLAFGNNSHAEGGGVYRDKQLDGGVALGAGSHAEGCSVSIKGVPIQYDSATDKYKFRGSGIPYAFVIKGNYIFDGVDLISSTAAKYLITSLNDQLVDYWEVTLENGPEEDFTGSFIKGYAVGSFSHAEGLSTAYGEGSHTEGAGSMTLGIYSHAEGIGSVASGEGSHAEGGFMFGSIPAVGGNASGNGSHAEGCGSKASGEGSHAECWHTTASGDHSHAEGNFATASGDISHAEGLRTTASGDHSHAEGSSTVASGNDSHAEGYSTTASGGYSHAEGDSTTASEAFSHAEGSYTTASGEASHAEGLKTTASGYGSHAEGYGTTASGDYSHAEGGLVLNSIQLNGGVAMGDGSHAEGMSVKINNVAIQYDSETDKYIFSRSIVPQQFLKAGMHIWVDTDIPQKDGTRYCIHNVDYTEPGYWKVKLDDGPEDDFTGMFVAGYARGVVSHTEGASLTLGEASHAEGEITTAEGDYSHAEGIGTTASGTGSHAEGDGTTASGARSHAEGDSTAASGSRSHAEGDGTTASGDYSHAEGLSTTASGSRSHAEGDGTTASGDYSHAEGLSTTASGNYSHAEGYNTTASGDYSHAEGSYTTASNNYSHAEGRGTTASGNRSHAEGETTTASGARSHAEGETTKASGYGSHAEGSSTVASGYVSHAEGDGTTASGDISHAEGCGTVASNLSEHAEGSYNISNHASDIYGNAGNTQHSIGIGTSSSNKKNAVEVMQNGDVYVIGIGGYDGTNPGTAQTLQQVLSSINNQINS